MKVTIDLNSPEIRQQFEAAIDARLHEIAADKIQAVVDSILKTKTDRLTDQWVAAHAEALISKRVSEAFTTRWNAPSEFQAVLAAVAEKVLREALTR